MNYHKVLSSFLLKSSFLVLLFSISQLTWSQNELYAPFNNGFVGQVNNNTSATNCYYLSVGGLGWSNIQFYQNSPSNVFVAQGNDIIGSLIITDFAGVTHNIPGFFNWRATELDKIVAYMNENPTIEIELGSHTDCRGSKASNEKLSASRAKASADYVKSRITNPKRIYGKGYGESQLVNKCECEGKVTSPCSEEEHQANRRTEFKVIKI